MFIRFVSILAVVWIIGFVRSAAAPTGDGPLPAEGADLKPVTLESHQRP
jgi:hypothetical protein